MKSFSVAFLCVALSFFISVQTLEASETYVRQEKGFWILEVDGHPFYVKGVGCGMAYGKGGEDYLKMAQEIGANSVRTWGTDQGTEEYLDQAELYGLKVAAGIWLNPVTDKGRYSYLTDDEYKQAKRSEVLEYVKKFKSHPAVFMWVVGNEAISFTKRNAEKIALCRFLEELIQEIHKIDPVHPVTYASAGINDLKYLAQYVPSLDIVGINEHGSIRAAHGNWEYHGFKKPYLFTEFGPYLSRVRPIDINGCSMELSDEQKARRYRDAASQIFAFQGSNLGGFAFHLGETTQESMTWWNLNEKADRRASFWEIYEKYTGLQAPHRPVAIKGFSLSKRKGVRPSEMVQAEVDVDRESDEALSFSYALSTARENVQEYYVNQYVPTEVVGQGRQVSFRAPEQPGIYRVYCFVKDEYGNIASQSVSVKVG